MDELQAMKKLLDILLKLEPQARDRALTWLSAKHAEDVPAPLAMELRHESN